MKAFFAKLFRSKKNRLIAGGTLLVLLGIIATVTYIVQTAIPAGIESPTAQMFRVSRGDLSTTITGTGKLISENVDSLSFSTEGIVEVLNVKVGQQVIKGEVLAGLKNTEKLTLEVENKELALQKAEEAIQDLMDNTEVNLAQALADKAAAGVAYEQAQKDLITKGQARCDKSVTEQYYYDYMYARHDYNMWYSYLIDGGTGYGTMYIQERMAPYKKSMLLNYANWKYCEGFTELEKQESEANLELAKATFEKATTAYDELVENNGIDPLEMSILEARKNDAERALSEAEENLANATLIAPFDGVITAVNGTIGLNFEKGIFIKIADLENEVVQTSIEETDLQNFKAGCDAVVTVTTHKEQTFNGTVTKVDPSLTTWDETSAAQGWVKLTDPLPDSIKNYSLGLDASVSIICSQATDVLLVPVDAIYKNGDASFVYVLDQNTKTPAKRLVEVGKTSTVYAEIKSGLQEGEFVVMEQES
ncbi:MAG: efflux RND transporter periplasmic adaptor subunit [Anaerolineaceae bacterium]